MEKRWIETPDADLRDVLSSLGDGKTLPSDDTLYRRLRPYRDRDAS
ncbi:MAG: hypothetical protein ACRDMH_02870 [Solirubrobacterales bacterium]